ncbi:MAG: chemotaxis protein CheW [Myxococcaceae bacterium]
MSEPRTSATAPVRTILVQVDRFRVGLPLEQVEEALRMVALDALPDAPAHCLGAFDLGGEAVPVVDLGLRLGCPPSALAPSARALIILRATPGRVALAVDRVLGLATA